VPEAHLLLPFVLATAIFAVVPGPGMLYAAAQTLASGRGAGWGAALGFHLAGLGHVTAAAFGVSALLAAAPALFTVMKLAGAAYLIGMGVGHLVRPERPPAPARERNRPTARRALRDGVVVEALNPKSALFFLAFLPQFTDPSAAWPVWLQVLVLGWLVNVVFTATDAVLVETSHAVVTRLRRRVGGLSLLRRLGGGVLVALGASLAAAQPP
jgi:threonine/homoserine/homoserine lactone efflux protein